MTTEALVLVVDDDPAVLRATSAVLTSEGFHVLQALRGADAVATALSHAPDVVLLDVVLPDMSGVEVCRRIKADPTLRTVSVLLLSSVRTSSSEHAEGIEEGADGYVARPISNRELAARVNPLLRLKEAEEAVRVERTRAETYLDIAEVIMVALDRDGRITLINRKGRAVLGCPGDQLLGRSWFEACIPERSREAARAVFDKIMAGDIEPMEYYEHPVVTKGGEERLIAWHNAVLRDGKGEIEGTLSSGEDITRRWAAERASAEQHRRLLSLLDAMPIPLCLIDMTHGIRFTNDAFRRTFGDPAGRRCYEVFGGRDPGCRACPTLPVALSGVPRQGEWVDGRGRTFSIFDQPFIDVDGSPLVLEIHVDMTDRKRAEEALRGSEERYRALVEDLNDVVFSIDVVGLITYVSPAVMSVLGYDPEELVGKPFIEMIHPEDVDRLRRAFQEVLGGNLKPREYRMLTKTGDLRWVRTSSRPMCRAGRLVGIQGVLANVTDRKRADERTIATLEQLQEARDEVVRSEKQAAVGRLAAGVAHEILNPAGIISSRLQFMENEELSEQARRNVRICREQIQRIVNSSRDLLECSADRSRPLAPHDLRRVIDLSLNATRQQIEESRIQVEYDPPSERLLVAMEVESLMRAVANLILNARDAMAVSQRKRLILAVHRLDAPLKSPSVLVTVADSGCGIPAGAESLVFEPFFTTKDPGKGVGLGLSISKTIIEECGGRIRAENNEMGGASFVVELPLHQG